MTSIFSLLKLGSYSFPLPAMPVGPDIYCLGWNFLQISSINFSPLPSIPNSDDLIIFVLISNILNALCIILMFKSTNRSHLVVCSKMW